MFTEDQITKDCTVRGRVSSTALIAFVRANVPTSFGHVTTYNSDRDRNAKTARKCLLVYRHGHGNVLDIDFADRFYRMSDRVREIACVLNRIHTGA